MTISDRREPEDRWPIGNADEFSASLASPLPVVDFPMTGAQVFARVCKAEKLAGLFTCPGSYNIINALAEAGIPCWGGRHEGAMASAADGFIRASGEVAACCGEDGVGLALMIEAIASANAARTPMLTLAMCREMRNEDTEFFMHLVDQQSLTASIRKFGKRIITPERVAEYAGYAFRQLKSGVPGPVHLDFPHEVVEASFASADDLVRFHDSTKYRTESRPFPDPGYVRETIDLIKKAERPLIWAGAGVHYAKGVDALKLLAEKSGIPVVTAGPVRGVFPDDGHRLSAGTAFKAIPRADVVMIVGQYCLPLPEELPFSAHTKYIRVDPGAEDIGRNIPVEVGIVADERAALEVFSEETPQLQTEGWVDEIAAARKEFTDLIDSYYEAGRRYTDFVHPAVIGKELNDFLYHSDISADEPISGANGKDTLIYMMHCLRAFRPGQVFVPCYQFGHIANSVGMATGVSAAAKEGVGYQKEYQGSPTICVSSDAGFAQQMAEIETQARYKLPVVHIVYSNNSWGRSGGINPAQHMYYFQENLRYDKVAEALGAHGEYVTRGEGFRAVLERCYRITATESIPTCINCQGIKEAGDSKQYPPGSVWPQQGCNLGVLSAFH